MTNDVYNKQVHKLAIYLKLSLSLFFLKIESVTTAPNIQTHDIATPLYNGIIPINANNINVMCFIVLKIKSYNAKGVDCELLGLTHIV